MSLFAKPIKDPDFDPNIIEKVLYIPIQFLGIKAQTARYLIDALLKMEVLKPGVFPLISHLIKAVKLRGQDGLWNMPMYKEEYKEDVSEKLRENGILFVFSKYITIDNEKVDIYSKLGADISYRESPQDFMVVYREHLSEGTCESMDYEDFHFFDFNRPRDMNHVMEIVSSMARFGNLSHGIVIETDIIDGKLKKWVVDGQHRLLACKHLGIPFRYYVTVRVTCLEDIIFLIAKMNSTSKKWPVSQYIKTWASLKAPDYVLLHSQHEITKLPVGLLLEVISGRDSKTATDMLKSGTFSCPDHVVAKRIISQIVSVKKSRVFINNQKIYTALSRVMRGTEYDHKKFLAILPTLRDFNFAFLVPQIEDQFRQIIKAA